MSAQGLRAATPTDRYLATVVNAWDRIPKAVRAGIVALVRKAFDLFRPFKDLLERLPTHPGDRPAELLPDAWSTADPDTRRKVAS